MSASRRRLWVIAGLAAWALVLGGLAVVSHRTDPPTVREQRPLSDAIRVVNEAVGRTVGLAGSHTVPVIMPIIVDRGCRITPVRDGATATGVVRVFTEDGGSADFLAGLGRQYPPSYQAEVSDDGKALRADAGGFVTVRGRVMAPGEVQVTVTSGCRPADTEAGNLLMDYPQLQEPAKVLTALGATSVQTEEVSFAKCPAGNAATTASALGHGTVAAPSKAAETDHGQKIIDSPQVFAYRRGTTQAVAVVPTGGRDARVYVTQLC